MVLRAKTVDLLQTSSLTGKQKENSELNINELKEGRVELVSMPRRLVLELTNACNVRCIMCGRDEAEFNNTFFDIGQLEKYSHVLKSAEEVTLFGWGEPTLHPKFIEILEYLDGFQVRKYFVTNGTRLNLLKEAIFDYKVDIMAVSLDGAVAETNDRIRVGSSFDEIVEGLASVVEEKKRRGVSFPYINFVYTVMRSNLHELPEMVRLTHRLGLEELKVVYLTVFGEELLEESLWDCGKEVETVFNDATGLAESLGVKIKIPYIQGEDVAEGKAHKDCFVGWRDFFVGSDGYVRPCQSTAMKLFRYDKYETFDEMWNSIEYRDFRVRVNDPATMPEECKRCYQSSHANWNKKYAFMQTGESFAPQWEKALGSKKNNDKNGAR